MSAMAEVKEAVLPAAAVLLAVLIFVTLVRAILGPRFTDRVIAVNMINTMAVAIICILSVHLREEFLVDVALVYALLSFLTVIVLTRLVLIRARRRRHAEEKEADHGR